MGTRGFSAFVPLFLPPVWTQPGPGEGPQEISTPSRAAPGGQTQWQQEQQEGPEGLWPLAGFPVPVPGPVPASKTLPASNWDGPSKMFMSGPDLSSEREPDPHP